MNYIKEFVSISEEVPEELADCMYDPQTSGGLLISVDKNKGWIDVDFCLSILLIKINN